MQSTPIIGQNAMRGVGMELSGGAWGLEAEGFEFADLLLGLQIGPTLQAQVLELAPIAQDAQSSAITESIDGNPLNKNDADVVLTEIMLASSASQALNPNGLEAAKPSPENVVSNGAGELLPSATTLNAQSERIGMNEAKQLSIQPESSGVIAGSTIEDSRSPATTDGVTDSAGEELGITRWTASNQAHSEKMGDIQEDSKISQQSVRERFRNEIAKSRESTDSVIVKNVDKSSESQEASVVVRGPAPKSSEEVTIEPTERDHTEGSDAVSMEDPFMQNIAKAPVLKQNEGPQRPEGIRDPAQVASKMSELARQGGGKMTISLHPANLGHLEVEVKSRGNRVEIRMASENSNAKAILEQNLGDLRTSIQSHDLIVSKLEVQVNADAPNQWSSSMMSNSGQHSQQRDAWTSFENPFNQGREQRSFQQSPWETARTQHVVERTAYETRRDNGQLNLWV